MFGKRDWLKGFKVAEFRKARFWFKKFMFCPAIAFSLLHWFEHESFERRFPSSHSSLGSRILSPHLGFKQSSLQEEPGREEFAFPESHSSPGSFMAFPQNLERNLHLGEQAYGREGLWREGSHCSFKAFCRTLSPQ